ncbi:MAG TPA: carotenoid biosynthesis protein [Anaerolineae bacterium]|nr:carotenoid biosynthesis protein [Anaerolineae bacterium]
MSQYLTKPFNNIPRPALAIIFLWFLLMTSIPIVLWLTTGPLPASLITASVVVQATAVFLLLTHAQGLPHTLAQLGLISLITFTAEYIGTHTGLLFGAYTYTDRLQPQLGQVPLLIPLAWFMMLLPAAATIHHLNLPRHYAIPLAALALTSWDLLLDPQMVSWDLWQWHNPGLYFGIPLQNFLGWFLTALLLYTLIPFPPKAYPGGRLLFTLTWFLETFGLALFWGQPGPALIGGTIMGLFVWLSWQPLLTSPKTQKSELLHQQ